MIKCAILDDYQKIALKMADWTSLAPEVDVTAFHEPFKNEDEAVKAIRDYSIIVIMRERTPFSASVLARLPKLKLLVTSGMRNAAIDLKAAAQQGITVCGTASSSIPPVEMTWALILGLARHLVVESLALQTNGPWQSTVGVELHGKQLGIIGLGKIGCQIAKIGQAFGMRVMAWSQNLTAEKAKEAGVRLAASKEELLSQSDFITIHLVLSERTLNLLNATDLALMKPSAYLVNTSRAAIVNQAALMDALEHRKIAGAGLDVFELEPLPDSHPFRVLPNVLATPHMGYVTQENYKIYFEEAVADIAAYLKGIPLRVLAPLA